MESKKNLARENSSVETLSAEIFRTKEIIKQLKLSKKTLNKVFSKDDVNPFFRIDESVEQLTYLIKFLQSEIKWIDKQTQN
jgi:hypothetical protein